MIQKNPYAAYNNSKIQTATPAELTLLLYEGAIKFTNIAIVAIEKGDIEKAHNNIRKAENIIREFQKRIAAASETRRIFSISQAGSSLSIGTTTPTPQVTAR